MKKKISAALAAAMLIGLVSGCAGNGGENAKNDGKTTIEIWTGDASAKQCWTELTNEYNNGEGKEKGIEIKFKFTTDNTTEVDVAAQNDKLPDIICPTFKQAQQFAKSGDIVPLEDVEGLKEYAENYNTVKKENQNIHDGKLYALSTSTMTAGLIYNKDLFKKAGIVDENGEAKPPQTLDEMVEDAKILTNKEEGVYGYSLPLKFDLYYTLMCPGANVSPKILNSVDYNTLTVDSSDYAKLFSYMLKLRDDGSLFPGAESLDNDTSRAYFAEGLIGMMPGMSWDVGVLTSQFVADCDWDVVEYPTFNADDDYPRYQDPAGYMFITKNGAAKGEKMAEAYKWLTSKEVITRFYEKGIKIPFDMNMVEEGAKCEVPQFASFAALVDDRFPFNNIAAEYSVEYPDGVGFGAVFAGKISLEESVEISDKCTTEGLRKAVENGTVDIEHIKEVNGIK